MNRYEGDDKVMIETRAVVQGKTPGIRVTCRACTPNAVTVVAKENVMDVIRRHMRGVHNLEVQRDRTDG